MNREIKIGNRVISEASPAFIVAEMSANHLMDYDRAVEIVKAAKYAGADAIKLQTYTADTITLNCDNPYFQIKKGTLWDGTTLHGLYQRAFTPWEWQPKLKMLAESLGLIFFSAAFDFSAVDFLEGLDIPVHKIASPEITDIPLIRKVAKTGKPILISTGIARLEDVELAVKTCRNMGNENVILLKCSSAYPSPYEEIHLRTIPAMGETFHCLAGLSDHTKGSAVAVASIALGGKVVEKHLTLNRADGGPDAEFSMEPEEFKDMVENIRIVEKALGTVNYELSQKEENSRELFSRSLFIAQDMKAGDVFTAENLRSVRPSYGLHTRYYDELLGKRIRKDAGMGTPMSWELLDFDENGEKKQ